MKISLCIYAIFLIALMGFYQPSKATNYYFHPSGNDHNLGNIINQPFKSLSRIGQLALKPGDSILLAAGLVFNGSIELRNISGTEAKPIVISKYNHYRESGNATINARDFASGIYLENCSHVHLQNLTITANGGGFPKVNENKNTMKCGVLVKTTSPGEYENIQLRDLFVKDIFFEEPGFRRGQDEVRTANGTQSYGWGIRFINQTNGAYLKNIIVEGCTVENVAHTGIKLTASHLGISDVKVQDNEVIRTGGPGIQMSRVEDALVKGNTVNFSGSKDDSRKWGRGSGYWCWGSKNVIIEHNYFMNANGPGDSAGCHIDFNCNDVVVQYNFSANNAGRFCREIAFKNSVLNLGNYHPRQRLVF